MIKETCKFCGKDFWIKSYRKGIAKFCSRKCHYKTGHTEESKHKNRLAHLGRPTWNKGIPCPQAKKEKIRKNLLGKYRGNQRYNWRGGRNIGSDGYVVLTHYTHPFRMSGNHIREHRLVMEKYLGRYLTRDEVIHHINNIKIDNRIENLKLFKNESQHQKYHHKYLK